MLTIMQEYGCLQVLFPYIYPIYDSLLYLLTKHSYSSLTMDQDSDTIPYDDVLTMMPTMSFDSKKEYLDVFKATYYDLEMMNTSDRKLELESRRKRLVRLEMISRREFTIKFSLKGFEIQNAEIEEAMKRSRGHLDFDCLQDYRDEFQKAANQVIEEKTETQDQEDTKKQVLDSKEKGCFLCKLKKWVKNIFTRKT